MKATIEKVDAAIEICENEILKDLLKSIKKDLEAQAAGIETPPPPKNP